MVMLDFICNGSVDLFGTGRERKIRNENICHQRDSNPHHASRRQESQRFKPLGHEDLMVISGLMSYMIMGYKFKTKTVTWQHVSNWWSHVHLNWMSDSNYLNVDLLSIIIVYRTLHWVSNHNRFHTGIVTYPIIIHVYQNIVQLLMLHLISNLRGRAV